MLGIRIGSAVLVGLMVLACARTPEPEDANLSRQAIADRDWELVALGDQADPLGAGGRRPTVRFTAADTSAGGFTGCNRWSARYTMSDSGLTFAPAISTKMACNEGMELETAFLAMIAQVRAYEATDSTLTLLANDAPLARFRAAAP